MSAFRGAGRVSCSGALRGACSGHGRGGGGHPGTQDVLLESGGQERAHILDGSRGVQDACETGRDLQAKPRGLSGLTPRVLGASRVAGRERRRPPLPTSPVDFPGRPRPSDRRPRGGAVSRERAHGRGLPGGVGHRVISNMLLEQRTKASLNRRLPRPPVRQRQLKLRCVKASQSPRCGVGCSLRNQACALQKRRG